jgi:transposase
MHIRYRVELDESERQQLEAMVAGGTHAVRRVKRAQMLLAADRGVSDAKMAATLRVGTSTVYRTKQRFVEHGPERALPRRRGRAASASSRPPRKRC